MHPAELTDILQTARDIALAAGKIIRDDYNRPRNIWQKTGPRDLVTDTDHRAQDAALAIINDRYTGHNILAEEMPSSKPDNRGVWQIPAGVTWIIDPLDGTTNFTTGLPFSSVSIGVAVNREPVVGAVYDPARDEMFLAARRMGITLNGHPVSPVSGKPLSESVISLDWAHKPLSRERVVQMMSLLASHCRTVRSLGSAALALAYVAASRVQLYVNYGLQPWDIAAGAVLISEAGGVVRQPDGNAWELGIPRVLAGSEALLDEVHTVLTSP